MKILITGASGFIGRRLALRMRLLGHKVHGIGFRRNIDELRRFFGEVDHIKYEEVDICDPLALCECVGRIRPEFIYHLAAQANLSHARQNPASTYSTNIIGSHNILMAASITPLVKGIHLASSSDVYGPIASEHQPIKEYYMRGGCNPYSISKIAMEKIGELTWNEIPLLSVVVTRLFTASGAGQYLDAAISYFAYQLAMIKKGLAPAIFHCGNIDNIRTFLDVEDVIEAFTMLPEIKRKQRFEDTVFNITGSEEISMRKIVEYLINLADVDVEIEQKGRSTDITRQVGDGTKFHKETGWSPRYSPLQAAERVFEYWMANTR